MKSKDDAQSCGYKQRQDEYGEDRVASQKSASVRLKFVSLWMIYMTLFSTTIIGVQVMAFNIGHTLKKDTRLTPFSPESSEQVASGQWFYHLSRQY